MIQWTLSSVIDECERARVALIVHDSTNRKTGKCVEWLQAGMEMYGTDFVCVMEDDHGFTPRLVTEQAAAIRQNYRRLSPNGL